MAKGITREAVSYTHLSPLYRPERILAVEQDPSVQIVNPFRFRQSPESALPLHRRSRADEGARPDMSRPCVRTAPIGESFNPPDYLVRRIKPPELSGYPCES